MEIRLADYGTGRSPGRRITSDREGQWKVYMTENERGVIFYDGDRQEFHAITNPVEELRGLSPRAYAETCQALGLQDGHRPRAATGLARP
jgi:hypothetical protein